MLSNSFKRMEKSNQLISIEDLSESQILESRSPTYISCWNYLQSSSFEAALDRAEDLVRRSPTEPDGYIFKARALFNLKRFRESELALMKVVKIAENNERLKGDVNGMIKLRDELANVRVEILRSHKFRDAHEIAEMHWNDSNASVIELIGFSSISKDRIDASKTNDDCEIVEIQLNQRESPAVVNRSTPKKESQSFGGGNLSLSALFPDKNEFSRDCGDHELIREPIRVREEVPIGDIDDLQTAGLRTALILAEEKNVAYEKKIKSLEDELRNVYTKVITVNQKLSVSEKMVQKLEEELQKYQPSRSRGETDKQMNTSNNSINNRKPGVTGSPNKAKSAPKNVNSYSGLQSRLRKQRAKMAERDRMEAMRRAARRRIETEAARRLEASRRVEAMRRERERQERDRYERMQAERNRMEMMNNYRMAPSNQPQRYFGNQTDLRSSAAFSDYEYGRQTRDQNWFMPFRP